jgi:hypothetical protein
MYPALYIATTILVKESRETAVHLLNKEDKKMKNVKFWVTQIFMVAMLTVILSSSAMAGKAGKGGKCADGYSKVKGICVADSGGSTGGGSTDTSTTDTSTGGGYTTGDQIGTTDGDCPAGYVWLDLYNRCIPIS